MNNASSNYNAMLVFVFLYYHARMLRMDFVEKVNFDMLRKLLFNGYTFFEKDYKN